MKFESFSRFSSSSAAAVSAAVAAPAAHHGRERERDPPHRGELLHIRDSDR